VYGLAADALDPLAVARVYEVKARPLDSALILHLGDPADVVLYAASVPEAAPALMEAFWPGPLTLVFPRAAVVPEITAGGRDNIGMRVPGHDTARDLVRAAGRPLVGPSANRSGRPSPMTAADVLDELGGVIDAVLDAGVTRLGIESTVLDLTVSPPAVLRPGAVTAEQLRSYLPELGVPATGAAPRAREWESGMRLLLVTGAPGPESVAAAAELARRHAAGGRRVGLLAQMRDQPAGAAEGWGDSARARRGEGDVMLAAPAAPEPIAPGEVRSPWLGRPGDLVAAAALLLPALRALEAAGCEVAVAAPLSREGLGLAIMNRLEKLATEVVQG
jgi:L-threonylcarbamoyladenylate synthase